LIVIGQFFRAYPDKLVQLHNHMHKENYPIACLYKDARQNAIG